MKIDQLLKFEPILKEKIWGGEKLSSILNKKSTKKNIGESWEISDVEENMSVVNNGQLKGKTLKELIRIFTSDLLGEKVYKRFSENFPLLIKFIDAKKPLSIQLHPNDDLAKKRHNSFGKTEMWYILQTNKFSNIIAGFKNKIDKEEYLHHLKNKSLLSILNTKEIKKGEAYFISTGTIHAIGAGVLLAEIQQTSDITYRVHDWDRQNPDGTYRTLHTKEAIDAINFNAQENCKKSYSKEENIATEIVSCQYFTTNFLPVKGKILIDHKEKDSFVIYMCVEGSVTFQYNNKIEKLQKGETILIPNCIKNISINSEEKSELLEVYIK